MPKAVSNTSPLLYLYRIGGIDWLPKLFDEVWIPEAVRSELQAGRSKGYDVPNPDDYSWLNIVNPKSTPSAWLAFFRDLLIAVPRIFDTLPLEGASLLY